MEEPLEEEDSTFTNISLADDSENTFCWRGTAFIPFTHQELHCCPNRSSCFRSGAASRRKERGTRRSCITHSALPVGPELLPEDLNPGVESSPSTMMNADMDAVEAENQVELEEKTRLINQVLELQHTLEDLSARVDAVKEENLKLKSENQVLGQYIENLMSASSVFQTTDTKSKRK
ncbi:short coiled-coil protein isoform X1 [Dermochelys coriacea]|uniref:short coiled-coil protein isoform X1 n=1 Tax=Dermochelys coriacea TaxID=27794 RepID=UPI001CA88F1B|nr:short coiled-coil protein isoform X1 [Dermochelys coriacea]